MKHPSGGEHRIQLTESLAPLVGRATEIARIVGALRDPDVRLLTLTGPGGIGKTRLAVGAASALIGDFPDGVFLVDLSPITDPHLVLATLARHSTSMRYRVRARLKR